MQYAHGTARVAAVRVRAPRAVCWHAYVYRLSPAPRFRVLDEVDQMLAMGFIEDVELILKVGVVAGRGQQQ